MTLQNSLRPETLASLLEHQRSHRRDSGTPTAAQREDRLTRLIDLVADNAEALAQAISADFGNRSRHETLIADIGGTLGQLKHARQNLRQWMRPQKAPVDLLLALFGGRARIEHHPLGVIGIVSPWNFPVYLALGPMGEAFAAGNSVMLKPSEFTPRTSDLLKDLIEAHFQPHEAVVVTGGLETGRAFTALPFDHLLFTGATTVGPHVLRAAADNMVPVTLELGGKSPVVVTSSADLDLTVARLTAGKLFNAGQVCVAPDYVLVPRDRMESLASALAERMAQVYPRLRDNPDYTHIVSDRQFDRLRGLVTQAREAGAKVVQVNPAGEDLDGGNEKILPPTLVIDPDPGLDVMREEIFGPILPILPYDRLEDAIAFVRARPHPLALYVFAGDQADQEAVIAGTQSGGVCINDTIMHITQHSLPFGGVGPSGTGAYHGIHGFRRFSHARGVYRQIKADAPFGPLRAPFGPKFAKAIKPMLRKDR